MGAMRRKTTIRAAAVGSALALMLAACGEGGDTIEEGAVQPADPAVQGTAPADPAAGGDMATAPAEEPATTQQQ